MRGLLRPEDCSGNRRVAGRQLLNGNAEGASRHGAGATIIAAYCGYSNADGQSTSYIAKEKLRMISHHVATG